jgi:hypothetical protein
MLIFADLVSELHGHVKNTFYYSIQNNTNYRVVDISVCQKFRKSIYTVTECSVKETRTVNFPTPGPCSIFLAQL